ncbi:hypothetical protein QFC22_003383 [Naganishia vaughanmartiniae]|uniref:Uncharacterized protein n=1 Tax=Naganishia vaughanmartiniae TaxID=1424756 RepID=A0ACC2X7T6_9TREE|nr:hypothetical protein QFC22_003383 [Naganishia vaughanmartiniae]
MAGHWITQRGGWRAFKKQDLHAMYGEFIGTVLFLLIGMAGVQATVTNLSKDNSTDGTSIQGSDAARLIGLFYISTAFGISLFAVASIFYRFTGGLFIEMFCTAALVLSVLMLAAEKSKLTPLAPLGFGVMLWAVELFSVEYTGGAINTARAFGPAVISGFTNYHWIYWLGEINPGQDSEDPKDAPLSDLPNESQSRLNSHSMA